MKQFIAYCGLDCEQCEARIATIWCSNFKENARSASVQKKCGFKFDHTATDDNWSEEVKEVVINHLDNILS